MANAYFHGKRVSESHKVLLDECERRGILSAINQGRRTLAEQWGFWNHYQKYGWPKAAYPSPAAPHIKWGREHHALDINDGIVDRVAAQYRDWGVPVSFNVGGEPWHMDTLDESRLIRAAHSIKERGGILATLKPGMRHSDVRALRYKMHDAGYRTYTTTNKRFYGLRLKTQVKDFQRKHGLTADGVVGQRTWNVLNKVAARD